MYIKKYFLRKQKIFTIAGAGARGGIIRARVRVRVRYILQDKKNKG